MKLKVIAIQSKNYLLIKPIYILKLKEYLDKYQNN